MTFEEILPIIKDHRVVSREAWGDVSIPTLRYRVITLMVENIVNQDVIQHMKSLSDDAKKIFLDVTMTNAKYIDQILSIDERGYATHWQPTVGDLLADDWYAVAI